MENVKVVELEVLKSIRNMVHSQVQLKQRILGIKLFQLKECEKVSDNLIVK